MSSNCPISLRVAHHMQWKNIGQMGAPWKPILRRSSFHMSVKRERSWSLQVTTQHWLSLIISRAMGQGTENLLKLEHNHIYVVTVPANCGDQLQPMDISINKPVKVYNSNFRSIMLIRSTNNLIKRKGCLQLMYDWASWNPWVHNGWSSSTTSSSLSIKNGFRGAGITDYLTN